MLFPSRFIVNIPPEELVSLARICFQVEQAHWFYEDFVRERNPHRLPSLSLRKFSKCIFDHCPMLRQYSGKHEEEFEDFLRYKKRVPVLGGIMLDERWEKVCTMSENADEIVYSSQGLERRKLVVSTRKD
jgi:mRNA-decapping enzyme subunit 2